MTIKEFNIAIDSFSDNIYRFILKSINNQDKAKDIVQDTFEKLWINKSKVDSAKIKSYLFTTAYHTMIDDIRREKKFSIMPNNEMPTQKDDKQYSDLQEVLNKAILKLPADQRSVVVMRDYEGYSYKEISKITKLSESKVKVYIYRARLSMKKFIGKPELVI